MAYLSQRDVIDYLCGDLDAPASAESNERIICQPSDEESAPLLGDDTRATEDEEDFESRDSPGTAPKTASFVADYQGMTALEIAAVVDAKKFLRQRAVQFVIDGIWNGQIVFWSTMSTTSSKQARAYDAQKTDPFCRLRVPVYLKIFEVAFFAAFLAIYYRVLVQKSLEMVPSEVMLYIWLVSFAYNGMSADPCCVYRADVLQNLSKLRHNRHRRRFLCVSHDRTAHQRSSLGRYSFRHPLGESALPGTKVSLVTGGMSAESRQSLGL